jgi:hypothetical protein
MEQHRQTGAGRQSETRYSGVAPDPRTLTILHRYCAGEISAREAAREIGPQASEHDVFAGVVAADLRLPEPSPGEMAREVAALRDLYGPHGPKNLALPPC